MKLILGVTGTREGMSKVQKENIEAYIEKLLFQQEWSERILHQGQCIGVDVELAKLLKNKYGFKIISHPPVKKDLLGICENDEVKTPKSYFVRNRNIVNSCDLLIVVPKENKHKTFGGTWYTHDFAVSELKPLCVFYPNGKIEEK